jgi:hypothetical protein
MYGIVSNPLLVLAEIRAQNLSIQQSFMISFNLYKNFQLFGLVCCFQLQDITLSVKAVITSYQTIAS